MEGKCPKCCKAKACARCQGKLPKDHRGSLCNTCEEHRASKYVTRDCLNEYKKDQEVMFQSLQKSTESSLKQILKQIALGQNRPSAAAAMTSASGSKNATSSNDKAVSNVDTQSVVSESNFQPDYDEEDGDEDSDNESVNPEDSASQAGTASQVGEGRTNVRLEILNKVLVQHGVVRAEAEDTAVTDPLKDAFQGLGQYKTKKKPSEGLTLSAGQKDSFIEAMQVNAPLKVPAYKERERGSIPVAEECFALFKTPVLNPSMVDRLKILTENQKQKGEGPQVSK